MNWGIAPHPSPLPMGEGVRSQPLFGHPLSHGERDRVRGVTAVMSPPMPEAGIHFWLPGIDAREHIGVIE